MTIAAATGRAEERACDMCRVTVEHREQEALSCGPATPWWMPENHEAPCGLPCISGGVKPAQIRGDGAHGYLNRCPRCGPLRVLPDVVEEMRESVNAMAEFSATPGSVDETVFAVRARGVMFRAAVDLLRCLDEIGKLTTERDEARRLLSEAWEQVTHLRMELADRGASHVD